MVKVDGVEVPTTYEEAVSALAEAHGEHHGPGTVIYRCDDLGDRENGDPSTPVRLLEVNRRFPSTRGQELRPIAFGRARDFPFPSAIILASSADLERLHAGQLRLPDGWHLAPLQQVWPR